MAGGRTKLVDPAKSHVPPGVCGVPSGAGSGKGDKRVLVGWGWEGQWAEAGCGCFTPWLRSHVPGTSRYILKDTGPASSVPLAPYGAHNSHYAGPG